MIPDAILRVPIGTAFFGGIGAGMATGFGEVLLTDPDTRDPATSFALHGIGGPVLAGAGMLGAMSFERTVGPFRSRFAVDAAEQISHRRVSLNWASKSGRIGAVVSGIGIGLFGTGIGSISGLTSSPRNHITEQQKQDILSGRVDHVEAPGLHRNG